MFVGFCPTCGRQATGGAYCPHDGTALAEQEVVPEQIERYRILRKVGQGGMSEVFEAEHVHIGKRVALKILRRELARDPAAVERLRREARTTSSLGHPNIVRVEDFGVAPDGSVYQVMEWLEGETLADRIARGPVPQELALDLVEQICAGLAAAHAAGIIHRDMKPANVFLVPLPDGRLRVKLLDFGIAKLALAETHLTRTGTFLGTPDYVAPEQALGDDVDGRADLYSVGVAFYQLLTGTLPFIGENFMTVLHQQTMSEPEPPSQRAPERGISPTLEAVVLRCLEKRPDARFASAEDLGRAIHDVRAGRAPVLPPRPHDPAPPSHYSRVPLWTVLFLVLGTTIAAIAFAMARSEGTPDAPPPPSGPVWTIPGSTVDFDYTVLVSPRRIDPGQEFTLSLEVKPGLALAPVWTGDDLEVELTFLHFTSHEIAHRAEYPARGGAIRASLNLDEAGKYHVEAELRASDRPVGHALFDLCIGADPGTPGPELEQVCPELAAAGTGGLASDHHH